MEEAENPITNDNFIEQLKKIGFATVRADIDSSLPLNPIVLIKEKSFIF